MRVVCENCGATYKIPESKLVKEVNKATCRKCGFRMMIRRPAAAVASSGAAAVPEPDEAATQVTANPLQTQDGELDLNEAHTRIKKPDPADLPPANEWSDEGPTQVRADPLAAAAAKKPAGKSKPTPKDSEGKAPGDMILALCATFAAAAGPMLLATNAAGEDTQRMAGLFLGLFGSLTCLFLLVTGNLWRQRGNVPISVALATVLSMGGTAFVEVAIHDDGAEPVAATDLKEAPQPPPAAEDAEAEELAKAPETAEELTDADDGVADAADSPPPPKTSAPEASAERSAPPPPEPVEEEEALDEPDFADIPPAATRSDAEERRRREMEEAAARAKAEREARDAERKRARETRRERRAKAAAPPAAAPAPAASAKMKSLPLTVVDTMIKTNLTVKRCFFAEKNATGSLPSRVNVYFTVMPTGKVASARVTTAEYKGTTLDSCLGRAFKGISFPPFEGDPLTMTYPFIL